MTDALADAVPTPSYPTRKHRLPLAPLVSR